MDRSVGGLLRRWSRLGRLDRHPKYSTVGTSRPVLCRAGRDETKGTARFIVRYAHSRTREQKGRRLVMLSSRLGRAALG